MSSTRLPRRRAATAVGAAALLGLSACGAGGSGQDDGDAGGRYPLTVENCGDQVTLEQEPERLVLLKSASVSSLHELGVLDRAVARAGAYPAGYWDEETAAELADIEHLTGEMDPAGHLQISKEVVIAQEPDLVMGEVENLGRDTLAAVDIPVLEEPALCPGGLEDPGFDSIYDQLEVYGQVFDREERAAEVIGSLQDRVSAVEDEVGDGDGRTAAVLYPTVGGGTTYAYGSRSMAHPQLETAGFENAFGDVDERVFEVTQEELLGRDPDVLVLLYSEGDPERVEQAITQLPGAGDLTAVENGDVMTHLFNFTEPPTPLAVDGLEAIVERFHR